MGSGCRPLRQLGRSIPWRRMQRWTRSAERSPRCRRYRVDERRVNPSLDLDSPRTFSSPHHAGRAGEAGPSLVSPTRSAAWSASRIAWMTRCSPQCATTPPVPASASATFRVRAARAEAEQSAEVRAPVAKPEARVLAAATPVAAIPSATLPSPPIAERCAKTSAAASTTSTRQAAGTTTAASVRVSRAFAPTRSERSQSRRYGSGRVGG